jgi:hypothetical protein
MDAGGGRGEARQHRYRDRAGPRSARGVVDGIGPFIIAPTLVVTTVVAYAAHPRFGRNGIIAAILAAAVFVRWALELLGVLSPTYAFVERVTISTSS